MKMPLTAIALILEFTHAPQDVLFPVIFAVSGSSAADRLCDRWFSRVHPLEQGPARQDHDATNVAHV